jgi:predicted kinase
MKQVIILKGLPASGKTTWAKEQVKNNPGKYKRVNKDSLRAMLDESRWSKDNEKMVLEIRDAIIVSAIKHGKHVIVDDTNLAPKHEADIRLLVKGMGVQVVEKFFDVPVDECIARDAGRNDSVGEKVIRDMYTRYLLPKGYVSIKETAPVYDPSLPNAIIVDIDGTVALKGARSPFEWEKVGEDSLNTPIAQLVNCIQDEPTNTEVIFVSGRDEVCRVQTVEWLIKHFLYRPNMQVFMRPLGNTEKDSIIKKRIYDEHIKGKYNVLFVLDDRNQTVEMWRAQGLTCLQVASGDF